MPKSDLLYIEYARDIGEHTTNLIAEVSENKESREDKLFVKELLVIYDTGGDYSPSNSHYFCDKGYVKESFENTSLDELREIRPDLFV